MPHATRLHRYAHEIQISDGRKRITCTPREALLTPDGIFDLVFNGRTQREHGAVEPLWLSVDVSDIPGWIWQVLQSESQLLGGLERRMIAEARALGEAGRQAGGRRGDDASCMNGFAKSSAAGK